MTIALNILSAKIVNRKQGRSSVAAAAYQSGQKLHDKLEGQNYDYEHKKGVVHTEIILPSNAPPEFSDREKLWNAVEKAEDNSTRRDKAQTAREIMLVLPNDEEITFAEKKELVIKYITETFVSQGMIADVAIHDKGDGNPHAHFLLPFREVRPDGFGLKNRDWNKQLSIWREEWAKAQNRLFMLKDLDVRVAHKSHKRRGDNEYKPTKHLGPVLTAMEKRGIKTRLGDYNRAIVAKREHAKQEREQEIEHEFEHVRERGR